MTHLSPPPGSLSQQAYHEDPDSRQVRRVLWTLLLGGTVVSFSNSALNPAIPVFMSIFSVDIVTGSWLLNGYVLAMSVGLMLSGYLSKAFYFKQVYICAITGFMVGSVLGMSATSLSLIIIARVIQGLAGGLIIPLSIGLLYQVYPSSQQGRAMALWGIVIMMSLAFGPLVGAFLVAHFAWWTLFAITLPLSALVVAMAMKWLPWLPEHQAPKTRHKPFDKKGFMGLLLWLLALSLWLNTLKSDSAMQSNGLIQLVLLAGFVVTAVIWWRYEQRQSNPLLNVNLFANKTYLHSTILSITQTIGLMMGLLFLPIIIQQIMHKSAMWTGLVLMFATLIASVTTHIAGGIVDKYGARDIGSAGVVISAVSMLMLAWGLATPNIWLMMLVMGVQGVGTGLAYLPTTTVGLSSLEKPMVTEGAALNNISRRIVSTLFIALATLYINSEGLGILIKLMPSLSEAHALVEPMQEVFVGLAMLLLMTLISARQLPSGLSDNSE